MLLATGAPWARLAMSSGKGWFVFGLVCCWPRSIGHTLCLIDTFMRLNFEALAAHLREKEWVIIRVNGSVTNLSTWIQQSEEHTPLDNRYVLGRRKHHRKGVQQISSTAREADQRNEIDNWNHVDGYFSQQIIESMNARQSGATPEVPDMVRKYVRIQNLYIYCSAIISESCFYCHLLCLLCR